MDLAFSVAGTYREHCVPKVMVLHMPCAYIQTQRESAYHNYVLLASSKV